MRIIEKLVSQLQPGDVLAPTEGPTTSYPRRVFGYATPGAPTPAIVAAMLVLHTVDAAAPFASPPGPPQAPRMYECRPTDAILRVEIPDLMLDAREVEIVLDALGHGIDQARSGDEEGRYRDVRERLQPPAPTLAEVLKALHAVVQGGAVGTPLLEAERLLQTARSAGVWPA